MNDFKEYFRGIWRDRYVLGSLVRLDLQMKYHRSTLGVAWSILTPLGLSIFIGLIYSILFGVEPASFIPLLFAGLNPWNFLSGAADGGTTAFISAEGYIKQTTVSPQIFPLRVALVGFVNFLYSVAAFYAVYLVLAPDLFGPEMLMVFPATAVLLLATIGITNITAVINLYIRDFRPLQSLILQALFYITPIIYTTDMLDEKGYSYVYAYNPFYYLIEIIKVPSIGEELLPCRTFLIASCISVVLFVVSVVAVMKAVKGLAYKL